VQGERLPADAAHDDPVAAPARAKANVGLAAKRSLHEQVPRCDRLARPQARLARLRERRRVGAEPDVLALDHVSCSCLSSRGASRGGRSTRRRTISCPPAQRTTARAASGCTSPRTLARRSASANSAPSVRAASRHVSQRHANEVADGEDDVYDLTVEGLHSFVAEDVVVHNSIEQDADLVMFVYRDEYYNPEETDSAGVAELLLAKHRNGATGMEKLAFQKRYAKFSDLAAAA
jgi:replicative DNA helicase